MDILPISIFLLRIAGDNRIWRFDTGLEFRKGFLRLLVLAGRACSDNPHFAHGRYPISNLF